ncbi:MAG: molybdenum cofactor guanylyltransferase [Promethearchaeota archaeon]
MSKIRNKYKYLAIAILIGGKSTRFGSDKGIFEYHGKPLISYQLETLGKKKYDIFLVAKSKAQVNNYLEKIILRNIMAFIIDDNNIISDLTIHTPLIGLYSAFKELNNLGYEKSFILSCDLPLIKLDVIEFLIKNSFEYDCCIPKWNNGFLEPLFTIYPVKKALIKAEKNVKKNIYKLTNLLDENWKINYISIESLIQPLDKNLNSFININEPSDLEKLTNLKI